MRGIIRVFLQSLEHTGLLNLISILLMFGLIFLADGFFLLLLSDLTGNFIALGCCAFVSLVGAVLVGGSFKRYSLSAMRKIRMGTYPQNEFIHLSAMLISLVAVTIPGFFSACVGFLLYVPVVRRIFGGIIHRRCSSELREVYSYRRMMEE